VGIRKPANGWGGFLGALLARNEHYHINYINVVQQVNPRVAHH
jgi:hypothetical protein